ncbi:MAG: D-glycerate dehydrogenase [Acidimicrobiia bacterium]|nr:D-glycerate dehydrogenase [Acidimicrobiia bacterium]
MARILVTRRLPAGALDPLAGHDVTGPHPDDSPMSHAELTTAAAGVDAIVCLLTDTIDRAVLTAGEGRLRVVATVSVGYDNVDVEAARKLGIAVANTPGVLDETTADTAWLLALAAARLAQDAEKELRSGLWPGWDLNAHLGRDVHGSTLGLVGFGRIGRAVARRAAGFDVRVLHHTRHDTHEAGYVAELDTLLEMADIVSLHVPGGPATHHLVDARRIDLIGATGVLVNTSRGSVVDEVALADALHDGRLFAAGLDVYEREPAIHPRLLSAPRAVLLPHIGSASRATRLAMAQLATSAVADFLTGRVPASLVVGSAGAESPT